MLISLSGLGLSKNPCWHILLKGQPSLDLTQVIRYVEGPTDQHSLQPSRWDQQTNRPTLSLQASRWDQQTNRPTLSLQASRWDQQTNRPTLSLQASRWDQQTNALSPGFKMGPTDQRSLSRLQDGSNRPILSPGFKMGPTNQHSLQASRWE